VGSPHGAIFCAKLSLRLSDPCALRRSGLAAAATISYIDVRICPSPEESQLDTLASGNTGPLPGTALS